MRHIKRLDLPAKAAKSLQRRQTAVSSQIGMPGFDIGEKWEDSRDSQYMRTVRQVLQTMAGRTQRCMYCCDSAGGHIEHFWPKSRYPGRAFQWANLLLCCADCDSYKGTEFPLLGGLPALIDPSAEDPWASLDFDPTTGNITARFDIVSGSFLPRGVQTVTTLRLSRREGMSEAYKRTFRRLERVANEALRTAPATAQVLWDRLVAEDDHGLLGWLFAGNGDKVAPFDKLKVACPGLWNQCEVLYRESVQ